MTNIINLIFNGSTPKSPENHGQEFVRFGKDILNSEDLTDRIYSALLSMMVNEWRIPALSNRKDFHASDIGTIYTIGPYIPCVERVSFSRNVDLKSDGMPGIRVVGCLFGDDIGSVYSVRPVDKFPRDTQIFGRCVRKYKFVWLYPDGKEDGAMGSIVLWFGISENGKVLSPFSRRHRRPPFMHALAQGYPSIVMNAWADSKFLWLANAAEDFGAFELKLRLGLDKEHIKSLFYARSLPVTETGRKRPILHWVRAHKRRIKEGIDIDINHYLRGITEIEMDGLRIQITQPNKSELHRSEPETINQAFDMYAPEKKKTQ